MKRIFTCLLFATTILLFACSKEKTAPKNNVAVNHWTFTEGSTTYSGPYFFEEGAAFDRLLQTDSNHYTLGMLGAEEHGYVFNLILTVDDSTFTKTTYKTGAEDSTYYPGGFYFIDNDGSSEDKYRSSNLYSEENAVMNYKFTNYNPATRELTIEFSGKAKTRAGGLVNITNGKTTVVVDKLL